jgi:hypothetical protein
MQGIGSERDSGQVASRLQTPAQIGALVVAAQLFAADEFLIADKTFHCFFLTSELCPCRIKYWDREGDQYKAGFFDFLLMKGPAWRSVNSN